MPKRQEGPRLRLHRETLRQISAVDLGRAAGAGYLTIPPTFLEKPHSNGWSSDVDNLCNA